MIMLWIPEPLSKGYVNRKPSETRVSEGFFFVFFISGVNKCLKNVVSQEYSQKTVNP
ncbi:hypothetical protein CH1034_130054 [Klebsiella pneumoniae]|nr:hypothetical protein CH1034_130054 [Klebsiella pneumoniae]